MQETEKRQCRRQGNGSTGKEGWALGTGHWALGTGSPEKCSVRNGWLS